MQVHVPITEVLLDNVDIDKEHFTTTKNILKRIGRGEELRNHKRSLTSGKSIGIDTQTY